MGEVALFQPTNIQDAIILAERMSEMTLLPEHLRKKPSDCLLVLSQALSWGMNPIAVAQGTSVIRGRLMFEGKLVAAVVNARAGLTSSLRYSFQYHEKTGVPEWLTVSGTILGETEPREIHLSYGQACKINQNGQMQQNPEQQMCYIGARIWARRHTPEVLLGVYAPDELGDDEPRNVTESVEAQPSPVTRPAPPPRAGGVSALRADPAPVEAEVVESPPAPAAQPEPVSEAAKPTKKAPAKAKEPPAPEPAPAAEEVQIADAEEASYEPLLSKDITAGCTFSGLIQVESVDDKKTKSGAPIKALQCSGDYIGPAFSDLTSLPWAKGAWVKVEEAAGIVTTAADGATVRFLRITKATVSPAAPMEPELDEPQF